MNIEEIKQIIEKGENVEIEFKQSLPSQQELAKTICAFANTLGGIFFIGVNNNKEIKGISADKDNIQKKISQANHIIHPMPTINIEMQKSDNKEVVVIIVHRTNASVFHSVEGAIFVRIGSTTTRLEGESILEFLRNRQILLFEETIESSAKIEDLDLNKIKFYLEKRGQQNYLKNHSVKDFLLNKKLAILQP